MLKIYLKRSIVILLSFLLVIIYFFIWQYNNIDNGFNLDRNVVAINCYNCYQRSAFSLSNEATIFKLNNYSFEEISLKGYSHIHAAVQLEDGNFVYVAVDNNGSCWLVKYFGERVVSKLYVKDVPVKMYAFLDTVVLLYSDTDRLASLHIVDFNNNNIQLLISNIVNESKFNTVFIDDDKILYKSFTQNDHIVWSLYENGNIHSFRKFGLCVGFIDDVIVFYQKISDIFVLSDLTSLYEFGKFEKYNVNSEKSEFMSFSIIPSMIVENFTMLNDGKHAIVYSYNEKSGGQKHTIVNLYTGEKKELKLKMGYWELFDMI